MATGRPKTYKVRFYVAHVNQPEEAEERYRIADLFRELGRAAADAAGLCPPFTDGGFSYEIRDLQEFNRGAVYMGVFAVLRDDAPHIRGRDGRERPIELAQDEGVIEKNHFIFHSRNGLMVYQVNQRANHPSRFEDYLTAMAGMHRAVVFGDILTTDAWEKMRRGIVKRVDVTIDAPRNPLQYDPGDFAGATLQQVERAGASRATVTLSTSRGHEGMRNWIKRQLAQARGTDLVKSMRVKIDGEEGLLDLLANTVRDEIEVMMDGRYPNTRHTFEELEAAHRRQREALRAHFGE